MRIAYLSTFYPLRGGIAQFNAALYRALQEQGHEVAAFTFSRQYPQLLFPGKTQYVTEQDKADEIESKQLLDTINPISYFRTAAAIRQWQPDVLLMKYWMSFFGPSLGTVARNMLPKTKVIMVLDNVIPHEGRFFDKAFTRYFLKANHGFISMSQKVENDLLSFVPEKPHILREHPLYDHFGESVERATACKKLQLPPEKKILLFFGFIRDYKGLDVLIDAFAQLDDGYHLLIAGEVYGSFEKYQQMLDRHPLRAHISVHTDYISDQQVPLYFSAADVCVLPYKSATQSGITSIAYHFELPLVATDVGGLKETIFHGKTGLMVPEPKAGLLAGSLKEYFAKGGKEAFRPAIAELKQKWSWPVFARKLTTFASELPAKVKR